jgi:inorganic pyrophosphatase
MHRINPRVAGQRLHASNRVSMNYLDMPLGDRAPGVVNAVIEIPMGSSNKYEYDKRLHVFRLDRNLYSPVHYPGDYGFIPSTLAEDGDPLDVLVLVEDATFPGCLVEVRPIGELEMLDQGKRDEKILAIATGNPSYRKISDYSELDPHTLVAVKHFFSIYKDLEGKRTEVMGWQNAERAKRNIMACHSRFRSIAA